MPKMLNRLVVMNLLVLSVVSTLAEAADNNYQFRAGASYSDNVRRTSTNEVDETIARLGLRMDISGESRRFAGSLNGDIEYREYVNDTFDDEWLPALDANVLFKISPVFFHWAVENKIGFFRRNPFQADTTANREIVNTFRTGPNFSVRLGNKSSIDLQGRYVNNDFEISNSDNTTTSGTVSLIRALSPNRSMSLNVSADRVEFDDSIVNTDFDRRAAYLGFKSQNARGELLINLGINEVDIGSDQFQGTLASVAWNRQLSEISSIEFYYDRRFSDAGDFFNRFNNPGGNPGDTQDIIPISDPFESQTYSLGYRYDRKQLSFSVFGFIGEDVYESESQFDGRRTGARLNVSHAFGSGWKIGGNVRLDRRQFDQSDRTDNDILASLSLERRLTKALSLSLGYLRADRSSNFNGQEYVENQYTLFVRFGPDS